MANIFERLDNREAFEVQIKGGSVWLREPIYDDVDRVSAMESGELKTALTLGLCLVEKDGERAFEPEDGESDATFAARVLVAMKIIGPSSLRAIQRSIQKLTETPDPEELAKN
jgi:hypothetical protein